MFCLQKDFSVGKTDVLVIVDVQNDFCPGGALPVLKGDEVVPVLNEYTAMFQKAKASILATRDWHPPNHKSFKTQGGKWPPHCIQDSEGAKFHQDLILPDTVVKITKGVRFDQDQNSVFHLTGLEVRLVRDGIRRLWVGGLAQDVCVRESVLDGRRAEFEIHVIEQGTRPVTPEAGRIALEEMANAGAVIVK